MYLLSVDPGKMTGYAMFNLAKAGELMWVAQKPRWEFPGRLEGLSTATLQRLYVSPL